MTAVLPEAGPNLRALTDDDLAELFAGGSEPVQAAVLAEYARQDAEADRERKRAERREAARARRAAAEAEWMDAAHAHYLRAEEACAGNLTARGSRVGEPFPGLYRISDLDFYGTQDTQGRAGTPGQASEEMREFCRRLPRPVRKDFIAAAFAPRKGERDYPWRDDPGWTEPQETTPAASAAREAAPQREPRTGPGAGESIPQPVTDVPSAADRRAARALAREALLARVKTYAPGALAAKRSQTMSAPAAAGCRHPSRTGAALCHDCPRQEAAGLASEPGAVALLPAQVIVRRHPEIDGAEVLRFARAYLTRFGYWPSQAAVTAAILWPAHAHARDASGTLIWDATPRLYLLSEEPGSGKSTLLELVGRLCPAVFGLDVEPSEAGLAHTIGREHATVLLDEGDILFGAGRRKAAIRAILNAGYTRNGTWLRMRSGGGERVGVFGAAAVAALDVMEKATGDSLAALMQRGIKIRVRRCPDEVWLPRLGRREAAAAGQISAMLAAWTADRLPDLQDAAETVQAPAGVRNRAEQIWRPLLAVAEVAGGEWPDLAADACAELALSAPSEYEPPAADDLDGLRDLVASWA